MTRLSSIARGWGMAGILFSAMCAIACGAEEPASDELHDFAPTSTEVRGSTSYDTYVLLAERNGSPFMDLLPADTRAAELCLDPVLAADDYGDLSANDALLVAAYCPEQAASVP